MLNFKHYCYFCENVEEIGQQLIQWGKKVRPDVTEPELLQFIQQLSQEEQGLLQQGFFQGPEDKRYSNSIWARDKFKEFLGTKSQQVPQQQEDPIVRKAKGLNQYYWQWILEVWKRNPNQRFDQSVFDYFKGEGVNPLQPPISYEQANKDSEEWHSERYESKEKASYTTPVTAGEKIGNMYMVSVNEDDEKAEGANMQNCIGDICRVGPDNLIFSLRDKNNNPHVSIEVEDGQIVQIKGKQNEPPKQKYSDYVVDWIVKHPEFEIYDLDGMPLSEEGLLKLKDKIDPDQGLVIAAKNNYMDIVKLMLDRGAGYNVGEALNAAANNGNTDMVKLMLSKGIAKNNFFRRSIVSAATGGHIDIVKLLSDAGAANYHNVMQAAAEHGHIDIVKLIISITSKSDRYSTLWKDAAANNALVSAAGGGHMNIVKLLLDQGATAYTSAMYYAAENGHMDITKLMISKGADDFNGAIVNAARYGHTDILKLLLDKGATNLDNAMRGAVEGGKANSVKLIIEKAKDKGVSELLDYTTSMHYAVSKGYMDIIKLILDNGSRYIRNYEGLIERALRKGYTDIVDLLQQYQ